MCLSSEFFLSKRTHAMSDEVLHLRLSRRWASSFFLLSNQPQRVMGRTCILRKRWQQQHDCGTWSVHFSGDVGLLSANTDGQSFQVQQRQLQQKVFICGSLLVKLMITYRTNQKTKRLRFAAAFFLMLVQLFLILEVFFTQRALTAKRNATRHKFNNFNAFVSLQIGVVLMKGMFFSGVGWHIHLVSIQQHLSFVRSFYRPSQKSDVTTRRFTFNNLVNVHSQDFHWFIISIFIVIILWAILFQFLNFVLE